MDIEIIEPMPDNMVMQLHSGRALEINDDRDWLKLRPLLNSLFRKYGKFAVEVDQLRV